MGGVCWYCHWGWPKQVVEIYRRAVERLRGDDGPLQYGIGHIVWSDENFGDDSIRWCLDRETKENDWHSHSATDVEIVRDSLRELLALPDSVRCCEPEDYDGEHPENYPPPAGVEVARH